MPGSPQRRLTIQTALTVPPAHMVLNNQEYLTAPVVMVVEGVLNGGYIPADALVPQDWDGVHITIGHPMDGTGQPHSARQPEVLAACGVGQVFHTTLSTGQRQGHPVTSLRGELWINLADAAQCGTEAQQAVAMLEAQTPLEVSTAFFSQAERAAGSFYGAPYAEIHHDLRPDHLALLPNTIGACSWADGCGSPRLNHAALTYAECACQGDACTCEKGTSMETPARGWRGFVQMLREFVSREETESPPETPLSPVNLRQREIAAARARQQQGLRLTTHEQHILALPLAYLRAEGPKVHQTDADLREALYGCLSREMAMDYTPIFLDAIDVENQTFVYRQGERLRRRSWTMEDGVVTLSPDVEDVQRDTTFRVVPVPTMNEEEPMASEIIKRRVNALIANERTRWTEEHRHMLENQDEAFLIVLEHQPLEAPPSTPHAPETVQEAIALMPSHLQEPMHAMAQEYEKRKTAALALLVANKQCPFSQEELQAMTAQRLEQLCAMAGTEIETPATQGTTSYLGRKQPGFRIPDDEDQPPEPPNTFARVVAKQKERGLLPNFS